jgi:thymidylate synthase
MADEPAIFGEPNDDYIQRELEWYLSQSLRVADIPGVTPKIWESVASREGLINSNYGYLVYSAENKSQYDSALAELRNNPFSRRAIMIYTRPSIQTEYCADGMSDFICTNAVQYLQRNGALHAVVQMRSNDVVFGYRNDYAWQLYVLQQLAADLGVPAGNITWQVGSLHVYERHYSMIEKYIAHA